MARLFRKVIHIGAEDSPNIALARRQQMDGQVPTGEVVVEGVIDWGTYQKWLQLWDPVMQAVGLRGEFWEGSESLMYPPEWLNDSARMALALVIRERREGVANTDWLRKGNPPFVRTAKGMGIDPGEGGDPERLGSAWAVVDEHGVLEVYEERTTDTSKINGVTRMLMRKWGVEARRVVYDRGGGGKQHADVLRSQKLNVRTVGFGDVVSPDPKVGRTRVAERIEQREERYAYVSMRCKMYHRLRLMIDPAMNPSPFAIPRQYSKLRSEMAPIPLLYDGKGRIRLPDKHRSGKRVAGQEKTLTEIVGHSPDLSDALVLAVEGMIGEEEHSRPRAGNLRSREELREEARQEFSRYD